MISDTLNFLYGLQFTGIKLGLENIDNLLKFHDIRHDKLKIIHVAGTNGKGSTSNIIANILQNEGYKVGLYTSPHLKKFNERIKVNGEMITDLELSESTEFIKEEIKKLNCTFFEATTAIALKHFIDKDVDVVLLEVGLGGRLDSTNIVTPIVSVITSIDYDHTSFLGNSLIEIAREKAGIIKRNVPVVIGRNKKFVIDKIRAIAKGNNSPVYIAENKTKIKFNYLNGTKRVVFTLNGIDIDTRFNLNGRYQNINLKTALTVLKVIKKDFPVSEKALMTGLESVSVKGRMEKISDEPFILIDAAHNSQGIKNLKNEVKNFTYRRLHLVTGTVSDKDYIKFIKNVFDIECNLYFSEFTNPRSLKKAQIEKSIEQLNLPSKKFTIHDNVYNAFLEAEKSYENGDLILLTGSHFLLGDFLTEYGKRKKIDITKG